MTIPGLEDLKSTPRALKEIKTFVALDGYLRNLNDMGINPNVPFIDAWGNASIAHGMAPSGDDWEVGYEAPRDPDTNSPHCCECTGHKQLDCDSGLLWEPYFPITALVITLPSMDIKEETTDE